MKEANIYSLSSTQFLQTNLFLHNPNILNLVEHWLTPINSDYYLEGRYAIILNYVVAVVNQVPGIFFQRSSEILPRRIRQAGKPT